MVFANDPTSLPDDLPPAPPRWVTVLFAVGFIAVQIFLEQYHAFVAEYVFATLIGIGGGVAIFWKKRQRRWFLPAVAVLALAQIAFFVVRGDAALPPHSGKGLMLVVIIGGALACAWLGWVGWLFDPRDKPRTSASRTVEIVLYGFAILAIGTVGFTWWAIEHSLAENLRSLRTTFVAQSAKPMSDLLECLRPTRRALWDDVAGAYPTRRTYDEVDAVRTTVIDRGAMRTVAFATVDARPLSTREMLGIRDCLGH